MFLGILLAQQVEEETFERAVACAKGFCVLQLRGGPQGEPISSYINFTLLLAPCGFTPQFA